VFLKKALLEGRVLGSEKSLAPISERRDVLTDKRIALDIDDRLNDWRVVQPQTDDTIGRHTLNTFITSSPR
jgi:hypothetical protein